MKAAEDHGFPSFFGSITRGIHDYDLADRVLFGGKGPSDLKEQHLDITSEPHIRAALAEKWAKHFGQGRNSVWVSSEVIGGDSITGLTGYPETAFEPVGNWVDLSAVETEVGHRWPFSQSRFHAIRPKS